MSPKNSGRKRPVIPKDPAHADHEAWVAACRERADGLVGPVLDRNRLYALGCFAFEWESHPDQGRIKARAAAQKRIPMMDFTPAIADEFWRNLDPTIDKSGRRQRTKDGGRHAERVGLVLIESEAADEGAVAA